MTEEEIKLFREKIEREFIKLLERGEDVRSFLYFPYNFLTPFIKDTLDEMLMEEAYVRIFEEKSEDFTVYSDSLVSVKMEEKEKKLEVLHKLLNHFTSKEEYEKCAQIHVTIKQLEHEN